MMWILDDSFLIESEKNKSVNSSPLTCRNMRGLLVITAGMAVLGMALSSKARTTMKHLFKKDNRVSNQLSKMKAAAISESK